MAGTRKGPHVVCKRTGEDSAGIVWVKRKVFSEFCCHLKRRSGGKPMRRETRRRNRGGEAIHKGGKLGGGNKATQETAPSPNLSQRGKRPLRANATGGASRKTTRR